MESNGDLESGNIESIVLVCIVKIPKKVDLTECGNWRGITLTFVHCKVFGRVLIDRIRNGVNSKLKDKEAGFRSGRGTVKHIYFAKYYRTGSGMAGNSIHHVCGL